MEEECEPSWSARAARYAMLAPLIAFPALGQHPEDVVAELGALSSRVLNNGVGNTDRRKWGIGMQAAHGLDVTAEHLLVHGGLSHEVAGNEQSAPSVDPIDVVGHDPSELGDRPGWPITLPATGAAPTSSPSCPPRSRHGTTWASIGHRPASLPPGRAPARSRRRAAACKRRRRPCARARGRQPRCPGRG